jgi:hypothetical protein
VQYVCPVCNYDGLFEKPYNSEGYGSDEICPCCGYQFGYDDYPDPKTGQREWRKKWIDEGYKWFSRGRKPPEGWDAKKQLSCLNRNLL